MLKSLSDKILIFLRGVIMGLADVVPGISGGTMAFITGIYPRLIQAISSVDLSFLTLALQGKFNEARRTFQKIDFSFLIPLLGGIGLAIILFSRFIGYLLNEHASFTFAFFFGLILASALFLIKKSGQFKYENFFFLIFGFLLAYLIAGAATLSVNHSFPVIFLAGAVAICAMILPGISGALILLLLNQYEFLLEAIHTFNLPVILIFMIGALIGILSFSKLLNYLLKNFRYLTFSFLTGLMLGSLRIPIAKINLSSNLPGIILFVLTGIILVIIAERLFAQK